ncbi:MAG: tRNA pseudouridine(55) synthase TruB [Chloroflexota bacterium]|jgi:tRNA pseudouridine55 synthase
MHGFINIDKPLGITSHDVVSRLRRITRIKRIGHAGTLDPAASGVLVVAVGQATRLIEYVQDDTRKRYHAQITLGSATDSDDATGTVIATAPIPTLTQTAIEVVLTGLTGNIMQVPPKVSALHVDGQRMYDLARQGKAPDLPARPVTVFAITLYRWDAHTIEIDVECGKGTYIRAIARDIGLMLGTQAHLSTLRRTMVGSFVDTDALTLDTLTIEQVQAHLVSPLHAIRHLTHITIDDEQVRRVRNGLPLRTADTLEDEVALCDVQHHLIAIARRSNGQLSPQKVFQWSD